MRRLLAVLLLLSGAARAADIVDATGRTVTIPDHVARILPAGPPAAVLLLTLAPDLMLGFPMDVSPEARAYLSPEAAALPKIPRLTGREDVTEQVRALKPDLIVDYGDVTPGYIELAKKTQEKLGVPTILLDGALAKTPEVLRALGEALHRQERAKTLASLAASVLAGTKAPAAAGKPHTVVYVRGSDAPRAIAPGVGSSEVFALLHWQVLAPPGNGSFRPLTLEQIAALDPDEIMFGDARMRAVVAGSAEWRALRAVREHHAVVAPALPFGWIEEPPSLNRLLGLAWLERTAASQADSDMLIAKDATDIGGALYARAPTDAQLESLAEGTHPLPP
jgi:iron complex transport system substrate-binding protein